jgi:hypothetical protein
MKSEPKTRELHYVETVFVCERCDGASHRVYPAIRPKDSQQ